jgi:hypothetical protein
MFVQIAFVGVLVAQTAPPTTIPLPAAHLQLLQQPPPLEFKQEGCPNNAQSTGADQAWILPSDYVELDYIVTFMGPMPYQLRIYADGRVERATPVCPLHLEDRTAHVDPDAARKLVTRARDGGFGQLCARYSFVNQPGRYIDGNETSLTLSLKGQTKTVINSVGNPPGIYNELSDAIEQLSPMGHLADYFKFTPERKAECDAISQKRRANFEKQQAGQNP